MQGCVAQLEPVAVVGERLRVGQQAHDDAHRFVHPLTLEGRVQPEHERVGDQRAGAHAKHRPAAGQVVEQHNTVGHHQRVVVRQADDARAELDGARALGRRGQVHLRRRDDLPAGAVVLADPGFVETELVEPLDQLQVALEGIGRVSADLMEWGHENPKLHPRRQSHAASTPRP